MNHYLCTHEEYEPILYDYEDQTSTTIHPMAAFAHRHSPHRGWRVLPRVIDIQDYYCLKNPPTLHR